MQSKSVPAAQPAQDAPRYARMVAAFVAVAVVGSLATLIAVWNSEPTTAAFELAKILMQLLLIVFGGAVLGFLTSQYQTRQAQDERERERKRKLYDHNRGILVSVLDRASSNYNNVKRARRLLRAQACRRDDQQTVVLIPQYDTQMTVINDIQLEFEALSHEVRTQDDVFTHADNLQAMFDNLEKYLGVLISEYEAVRPQLVSDTPAELSKFKHLQEFLGKGGFSTFAKPFHLVQEQLRYDLKSTTK